MLPIPEAPYDRLKCERGSAFDYVFLQPLGKKRHTESSINDAWNNFKRELDIHMGAEVHRNKIIRHCYEVHWDFETEEQWKALVPYSLRHTYCTDLQRAGVPINIAKYLMGHSDISVTGNTYTDETPDVVFGAVEKLEIFLISANKKSRHPRDGRGGDKDIVNLPPSNDVKQPQTEISYSEKSKRKTL